MDPPVTTQLGVAEGTCPAAAGSWVARCVGARGQVPRAVSPPMAWEFLPWQAGNPAEMADCLQEGCLVPAKNSEQLLVLCWDLTYT